MVKISCFGDEIASDIDTQIEVMVAQRVRYLELRSADGVPVLTLDDDHARTIKDKLAANGIRVSAIASPIGKVKVTDPFEPHLEAFGRAIDLARFFETPNIRVFSYYAPEGGRPVAYRDEIMRRMRAKADLAEKAGVVLALENHPGFGVSREVIAAILEEIPSPFFGWNFDMENAYRVPGQTAFDFLNDRRIMTRLVHVHAKNFAESPDGWQSDVALDEGVNDVRAMLAKIKAAGYDDWISIEFAGTTREKLRRSARFLRATWDSLPRPS